MAFIIDEDLYEHPRTLFGGPWGTECEQFKYYPVGIVYTLKNLDLLESDFNLRKIESNAGFDIRVRG